MNHKFSDKSIGIILQTFKFYFGEETSQNLGRIIVIIELIIVFEINLGPLLRLTYLLIFGLIMSPLNAVFFSRFLDTI